MAQRQGRQHPTQQQLAQTRVLRAYRGLSTDLEVTERFTRISL
jgi:hypothetical protein